MKKENVLSKFFGRMLSDRSIPLAEDKPVQIEERTIVLHQDPIGSSGIQSYAGYSSEDYLSLMRGHQRADVFDKMRRSESQIKMVTSAVKNPIKKATWEIEPADDTDEAKLHAEFAEHVLFHDMDKPWRKTLGEALTMVEFGHAAFEVTHKVVIGHPKFGDYNGIRSLGWRSPRTIHRWNLDPQTGKLKSITQIANGDLQKYVDIPAEFLLVFSLEQEGDNYEGISMLRPCYGAYSRKATYLKLEAIGVEKYSVPTPILKVPPGKENSPEYTFAKRCLEVYTSHQSNYLTIPQGWEIDFPDSKFDPEKLGAAMSRCDKDMVKTFLANFLELGIGSTSGSYSLSFDLSDFFLGGIEHIADEIKEGINLNLIPALIQMKFGPQEKYPTLTYSGITDAVGEEFAKVMDYLTRSKVITPDDPLEDHVRKRYKLPKKSDIGQRVVNPPQPEQPKLGETRRFSGPLKLAEKNARQQIGGAKAALKPMMQDALKQISKDMITEIMSKVRKLPPSQQLNAIKNLKLSGSNAYRSQLLDALSGIASQALEQARKEVPKAKKVKLSESEGNLRLSDFDKLPNQVQSKVQTQAQLLVDTQIADLEKAVYFQFQHSVDSTDSDALIQKDLQTAADDFIEGASVEAASGNTAALIVNTARNAFFFDDQVIKEIDTFTFVNGDPVSPICQDLAGRTFEKDDPEAQRYMPPLHHNCKSFIVPNLVGGTSKEPDPEGLKPSSASLEKFITLSEQQCCGSHE